MLIFQYGQKEIEYLKSKDKILGQAIDKIGLIKREINPDPFVALIPSIISQQISKKAAATVWNRLSQTLGHVTPENIIKTDLAEIQGCGMSLRKARYIKGIAEAAFSGQVEFDKLQFLEDEDIIKKLILPGVGT